MSAVIETTPQMDLATHDMEPLGEELHSSHAIDRPLLQRREQREAAHTSLQGLLATVPRKSIEPMGLRVDGAASQAVRAMPALSRAGQGNDERLWPQPGQAVETDLGADEGVRMVDGSDGPQQGVHAVGVQRQDCGELGPRANCQAGGCVGSGSSQGSTGLERRW